MTTPSSAAKKLLLIFVGGVFLLPAENVTAYTPFTPVQSVCPTCKSPQPIDTITFKDGTTIQGNVVGQNSDYHVVYRYGEYRAIKNDEIQAIKWGEGKRPNEIEQRMQITLKNGSILSGLKKSEKENPAYLVMELPELKRNIIVFKSLIVKEYPPASESVTPDSPTKEKEGITTPSTPTKPKEETKGTPTTQVVSPPKKNSTP